MDDTCPQNFNTEDIITEEKKIAIRFPQLLFSSRYED